MNSQSTTTMKAVIEKLQCQEIKVITMEVH